MTYTFLKGMGIEIGDSLLEEEQVPLARELLKTYGNKLVLPIDSLAAKECSEDAISQLFSLDRGIPQGYQGLDIGSQTITLFEKLLADGKTILWNGPLGVYELDRFAQGTLSIAKYIASLPATTVVGGGDLIAAVNQAGIAAKLTHISTGGGATLEFIEQGTLPGIEALSSI